MLNLTKITLCAIAVTSAIATLFLTMAATLPYPETASLPIIGMPTITAAGISAIVAATTALSLATAAHYWPE